MQGGRNHRRPDDLRRAVHDNLDARGLDVLDLVNLRHGDAQGPQPGSLAEAPAPGTVVCVPFFPLGGFSPRQSSALSAVAGRRGATPTAVTLAWLLQRSPNVLLTPGTSSVAHLRENVAGAGLALDGDDLGELDRIGRGDAGSARLSPRCAPRRGRR